MDGVSRRGFLGGALAAAGAGALAPGWLGDLAGAATPVAPTDGLLAVVTLSGGNDALNTLVPRSGAARSRYEQLRGTLALPAAGLLPVTEDLGLHASLPKLAARYGQGDVAIVQGVGQTTATDLSHFTSMASVMAGTATSSRSTGWLGRFLDGVTEWDSGLRGAAVGSGVPLHLVGTRAKVTALPTDVALWGAGSANAWERGAMDALRAMAGGPSGLGQWGDRVAAVSRDALDLTDVVHGLLASAPTAPGLGTDLAVAARLLNAGLGTRVVAAEVSGWDTHAQQLGEHATRLADLDAALDGFFATLRPEVARQTVVLVVSEFGRRAAANGGLGTDHGNAGLALLIGDAVRGGLHAAPASLTSLDASGSLVPTVDVRSVYATVLDRWLAADPSQILGAGYAQLDLLARAPGA